MVYLVELDDNDTARIPNPIQLRNYAEKHGKIPASRIRDDLWRPQKKKPGT